MKFTSTVRRHAHVDVIHQALRLDQTYARLTAKDGRDPSLFCKVPQLPKTHQVST